MDAGCRRYSLRPGFVDVAYTEVGDLLPQTFLLGVERDKIGDSDWILVVSCAGYGFREIALCVGLYQGHCNPGIAKVGCRVVAYELGCGRNCLRAVDHRQPTEFELAALTAVPRFSLWIDQLTEDSDAVVQKEEISRSISERCGDGLVNCRFPAQERPDVLVVERVAILLMESSEICERGDANVSLSSASDLCRIADVKLHIDRLPCLGLPQTIRERCTIQNFRGCVDTFIICCLLG